MTYGLSTDRLTPHPFNLCSNAGSTHTSVSQTQPLYMTLNTCTQLLWSTMARPVLSATCSVKPLYGLCCSSVSGSWQSSYSLFHLYVEKWFFFFRYSESYLPWGAMLNIQWLVWESESGNTKFNRPAPHSHLRPCNTNESHDTGEIKWLIGPNSLLYIVANFHFFSVVTWKDIIKYLQNCEGCTHFCEILYMCVSYLKKKVTNNKKIN